MSIHYKPTMGRAHSMSKSGRVLLNDTVKRLQLDLGAWVRERREARGLTQKQLGALIGVTDNHISDIENGIRKMSPERYIQFAKELGIDRAEFGKKILLHYDPFTYQLIFGGKRVEAILSAIPERLTEGLPEE